MTKNILPAVRSLLPPQARVTIADPVVSEVRSDGGWRRALCVGVRLSADQRGRPVWVSFYFDDADAPFGASVCVGKVQRRFADPRAAVRYAFGGGANG
jgi:hypothetical protein